MTVESATYISQLDPTNPSGSGPKSEGDDHLRLLKGALKSQFPNFGAAAMNASTVELNYCVGVTSLIQTQLDAKAPLASPALTGTPSAPTPAAGTNSTRLATMEALQTAVALVNAQTGVVASFNAAASFSVGDGQIVAATNAAACSIDMSASWTVGAIRGVVFDNSRLDNTVDLGAYTVKGWNGATVTGTLTHDKLIPLVLRNFGDYLRAV